MLTLNDSFILANQTRRTFVIINVPRFPCQTKSKHTTATVPYYKHTIYY